MTIASDSLAAPAQAAGQWMTQRAQYATRELGDCVEWNTDKLGGAPVLKGTRISVAQILAELGEGQSAEEVAADFDLDVALVKRLVQGLVAWTNSVVEITTIGVEVWHAQGNRLVRDTYLAFDSDDWQTRLTSALEQNARRGSPHAAG